MKRSLFFWVLSIFAIGANGQTTIAYVTDTSIVGLHIVDDDTIYGLKPAFQEGRWEIYFDSTRRQLASTWYYPWKGARADMQIWSRNGLLRDSIVCHEYPFDRFEMKTWYSNGQLRSIRTCSEDSCIGKMFYQNGQLMREEFSVRDSSRRNEMSPCSWIEYYENGQMKYTYHFVNTDTIYTVTGFFSSGAKQREYGWWNGFAGPYTEWYENGQLKTWGQYETSRELSLQYRRKRIGHWKYYSESGRIEREEWYDTGTVKFKTYNENGSVKEEGKRAGD